MKIARKSGLQSVIAALMLAFGLLTVPATVTPAHAEFALGKCIDTEAIGKGVMVDCVGRLRTTSSSEADLLRRLSFGMTSSVDCSFRVHLNKTAAKAALVSHVALRLAPFTADCQLGAGALSGPKRLPVDMTVELRPVARANWRAVPVSVQTPGNPGLYATKIQEFLEESTDLSNDITRTVAAMVKRERSVHRGRDGPGPHLSAPNPAVFQAGAKWL